MERRISLEALADKISEEMKKGANFHFAFFNCFPFSAYFEHEQKTIKSRVGKILNGRKQAEKQTHMMSMLSSVRQIEKKANESECPLH